VQIAQIFGTNFVQNAWIFLLDKNAGMVYNAKNGACAAENAPKNSWRVSFLFFRLVF
jgi:hypothetical protein